MKHSEGGKSYAVQHYNTVLGVEWKRKRREKGTRQENGGDFHSFCFSAHILIATYVEGDKENITKDLRSSSSPPS